MYRIIYIILYQVLYYTYYKKNYSTYSSLLFNGVPIHGKAIGGSGLPLAALYYK